MAQFSFINSPGGVLVPATPESQEYLAKIKLNAVIEGKFTKVRNGPLHKRFFALLNLGFKYWQPKGGSITPDELNLIREYNIFLCDYSSNYEAFESAAAEFFERLSNKRVNKNSIELVKSFEAFRHWVTIKSGFFDLINLPDGSLIKKAQSISFAKMDDLEFNELYKSAFNVLWQFILSRIFSFQHEAEQAALELLSYSMQGA